MPTLLFLESSSEPEHSALCEVCGFEQFFVFALRSYVDTLVVPVEIRDS